jgi:zinc protease
MRQLLTILVVALGLACASGPRPPPNPVRKTSTGLTISMLALQNGLRVVVVKDPAAEEVSVTTRYAVGAADDDPSTAGTAHLVEHLMFQQILGDQSLMAHLESFATSFNATTTLDATTYTARARPTFLDKLLSMEAVRMGLRCTSISESAFAREREVVVNETMLRAPLMEVFEAMYVGLYPDGHPYRRARATTDTLRAITLESACAFADAHYSPKNAVLVVSGPLSDERLADALGKFLARIPRARSRRFRRCRPR